MCAAGALAPPELCNVCNAQILSVIKIFYIPVEIIIADCSPSHAVIQQGPSVRAWHFYWVTIIVPITCSLSSGPGHDGVWCVVTRPVMTTCTCHECQQALSLSAMITSPLLTIFNSQCSTPDPWCSWCWHWHLDPGLRMEPRSLMPLSHKTFIQPRHWHPQSESCEYLIEAPRRGPHTQRGREGFNKLL